MNLPVRYDPACGPPGAQLAMFLTPPERGLQRFTVVDAAGFERVTTNALAVAMFATRQLLLAEGEAWGACHQRRNPDYTQFGLHTSSNG